MAVFGMNVMDFGAVGDGVHDDTAAIQAAIDAAAEKGGGRILFPYTKNGYRLASPAREFYNGQPVRSQLVIPPGKGCHISLEGEMPCLLYYGYRVVTMEEVEKNKGNPRYSDEHVNHFGTLPKYNTFIFSDWDAPGVTDPEERPWSMISAPVDPSDWTNGHFSVSGFSMANLEFRVKLDREKMYPTQSAANFQNCERLILRDCQFCLNETVGDTPSGKELAANPCHAVGLLCPADQSDGVVLENVSVQGFRYGIVASEHLVATNLIFHNCEECIVCHDVSHLSLIDNVLAERCAVILSTTREKLFGLAPGPCFLRIRGIDIESGGGNGTVHPVCDTMKWGVYDPEKRLVGDLVWHEPWGPKVFPALCSDKFKITRLGE